MTGAGISTFAGIPDFRSSKNTILETGPGNYEQSDEEKQKRKFLISHLVQTAIPTKSHMAIKALFDNGYISNVISQNTDGLHFKSGIPFSNLIEFHGNVFYEFCPNCGASYIRDFRVCLFKHHINHLTDRYCNHT